MHACIIVINTHASRTGHGTECEAGEIARVVHADVAEAAVGRRCRRSTTRTTRRCVGDVAGRGRVELGGCTEAAPQRAPCVAGNGVAGTVLQACRLCSRERVAQ